MSLIKKPFSCRLGNHRHCSIKTVMVRGCEFKDCNLHVGDIKKQEFTCLQCGKIWVEDFPPEYNYDDH